jgi:hypothetical protein
MPADVTPTIKFNASEIAKQITFNVHIIGYNGWLIRLRIAIMLIKLAAMIAGVGMLIDERPQAEAD